jgi:hypothetical protein
LRLTTLGLATLRLTSLRLATLRLPALRLATLRLTTLGLATLRLRLLLWGLRPHIRTNCQARDSQYCGDCANLHLRSPHKEDPR